MALSIKSLIDDLIKSFPEDLAYEFESDFRMNLASLPIEEIMNGTQYKSQLHILTNTLLSFQAKHDTRLMQLRNPTWTPIIAAFINYLGVVHDSHNANHSPPSPHSSRTMNSTASVRPKNTERPKTAKENSVSKKGAKEQPSTSKATVTPVVPKGSETSMLVKPSEQEGRVIIQTLARSTARFQPYPNYCKRTRCMFCKDMYLNMGISRCTDECTKAKTQCPGKTLGINWYPHCWTSIWRRVRKHHDNDVAFSGAITLERKEGFLLPIKDLQESWFDEVSLPDMHSKKRRLIEYDVMQNDSMTPRPTDPNFLSINSELEKSGQRLADVILDSPQGLPPLPDGSLDPPMNEGN